MVLVIVVFNRVLARGFVAAIGKGDALKVVCCI